MTYLFNNISDFNKRKLAQYVKGVTRTYKKDECIFREGDKCNSIAFIKKGGVVAKNLLSDGHEMIIRHISKSNSFGEGLIFSNDPTYKATFLATNDTEITFISKDSLVTLMRLNSEVGINLFKKLSDLSYEQTSHIKLLSLKKVSNKVACYFYLISKEKGKTFSLTLNKTEIAQYLNIERPTFSKELNYLIKNNIISYSKKKYTVNDEKALIERI
ncbi:MAG: Crp/Fnr family transcriptional regulator [Acholeplasmatales bacterium]|nr:Crp/Fnr family transcriptional regulator [Acholeplasmatales bacterium]